MKDWSRVRINEKLSINGKLSIDQRISLSWKLHQSDEEIVLMYHQQCSQMLRCGFVDVIQQRTVEDILNPISFRSQPRQGQVLHHLKNIFDSLPRSVSAIVSVRRTSIKILPHVSNAWERNLNSNYFFRVVPMAFIDIRFAAQILKGLTRVSKLSLIDGAFG